MLGSGLESRTKDGRSRNGNSQVNERSNKKKRNEYMNEWVVYAGFRIVDMRRDESEVVERGDVYKWIWKEDQKRNQLNVSENDVRGL